MVKKHLGVSVFAQMTLVTLRLSQTVGITALVTQHPSVVGKPKQLQALLSIRCMAQEGEACKKYYKRDSKQPPGCFFFGGHSLHECYITERNGTGHTRA